MPLPDTDEADGNASVAAATRRDPLLTPPKPEPEAKQPSSTTAQKAVADIEKRQAEIDAEIKQQQLVRSAANQLIAELREESALNTRLLNAARGRKRS